jgi:hypothetical protein
MARPEGLFRPLLCSCCHTRCEHRGAAPVGAETVRWHDIVSFRLHVVSVSADVVVIFLCRDRDTVEICVEADGTGTNHTMDEQDIFP